MDIEDMTTKELEKELAKRDKEKAKEYTAQHKRDQWKRWENRERCDVLGYAHGNPTDFRKVSRYILATLYVNGNLGINYYAGATVAKSVDTYFHNAIDDPEQRELSDMLSEVASDFVKKITNMPDVIVYLAGLDKVYEKQFNSRKEYLKYRRIFEKALIERLCEFTISDLLKAQQKMKDKFGVNDWQREMIKKAIAKLEKAK